MPDMSKKGAHIQKMRNDWESRIEQNRKKAAALHTEADALAQCCYEWDEALREEDAKDESEQ